MASPEMTADKIPNLRASSMKRYRKELGLSESQVAGAVGIADDLYKKFEANQSAPSQPTMEKLKKFFEKSLSQTTS